jgi:hypothetical protein
VSDRQRVYELEIEIGVRTLRASFQNSIRSQRRIFVDDDVGHVALLANREELFVRVNLMEATNATDSFSRRELLTTSVPIL